MGKGGLGWGGGKSAYALKSTLLVNIVSSTALAPSFPKCFTPTVSWQLSFNILFSVLLQTAQVHDQSPGAVSL